MLKKYKNNCIYIQQINKNGDEWDNLQGKIHKNELKKWVGIFFFWSKLLLT
jgi:hypothetical protein